MAKIKRHWKTSLLCLITLVGVAGWLLVSNLMADPAGVETAVSSEPIPAATVSSAPEEGTEATTRVNVDPDIYCGIRTLREEVSLRNEDLAAMGCTQANAQAVFEAIVEWYEANKVAIDAARGARLTADRALRTAMRKIGMGPRDEALIATLPALKQAVVDAAAQRRALVNAMVAVVEAKLTSSQKAVWAVAKHNAGLPSAYRYATDISGEQISTLMRASRSRHRRQAAAKVESVRSDAATAFRTVEASVLGVTQQSAISAARANIRLNMRGIVKAFDEVLPMPEALKVESRLLDPPTEPGQSR